MMKLNQWLAMTGMGVAFCLGASNGVAQDTPPVGGRPDRGGFGGDPAQFQERMMENVKERLEVNDDAEWKAIQPLVQKVMDSQRQVMGDRVRGMFGAGRGGRGGGGPDNTSGDNGGRRRFRGGPFGGGEPSPEAEALQRAIDSKASNSELKAALTKFIEARKAKQADLEKSQADLRKVLSVRQEAAASLMGLL